MRYSMVVVFYRIFRAESRFLARIARPGWGCVGPRILNRACTQMTKAFALPDLAVFLSQGAAGPASASPLARSRVSCSRVVRV